MTAFVRSDGISSVPFVSSDKHVRELSFNGATWSKGDLTALTGAALADGSSFPRGYVRADNVSAIVYVSGDNHVRELALIAAHG